MPCPRARRPVRSRWVADRRRTLAGSRWWSYRSLLQGDIAVADPTTCLLVTRQPWTTGILPLRCFEQRALEPMRYVAFIGVTCSEDASPAPQEFRRAALERRPQHIGRATPPMTEDRSARGGLTAAQGLFVKTGAQW